MNWEEYNKAAFCQIVQTLLLKSTCTKECAVNVLYLAHRCKQAGIPGDLPEAVREFVAWAIDLSPRPEHCDPKEWEKRPSWVAFPTGAEVG